MKIVVLLFILTFLVSSPALPQSTDGYRVVRIVGAVQSTKLNRSLKTEDVIPPGDNLKFGSAKDYLIVFSPKGGRKRIVGVPDNAPRELSKLLESFVKPDERSTATRGSNPAYLDVIKTDFQDTVLILGSGLIELDPKQIPITAPGSIKAQYKTREGKNMIIRVSEGQTLHLDRATLFPESVSPASRIMLLYYEIDSNNPLDSKDLLGNFSPIFADDTKLLPEVKSIVEAMKGSSPDLIEKEVSNYLTQEYAKPSSLQLNAWLKSNRLLP